MQGQAKLKPSRRHLVVLLAALATVLSACTELGDLGPGTEILSFQSAPLGTQSESFRLSWEVRGLSGGTLTLSPGPDGESEVDVTSRTVSGVGGIDVHPQADTTYRLVARNGSSRAEQTVLVRVTGGSGGPSITRFSSEPSGDGFRLSWTVAQLGDGSVVLEPGPDGEGSLDVTDRTESGQGSVEVVPDERTTYRLFVENDAGSAQRTVTVDPGGGGGGPGPSIDAFEADAAEVNEGVAVDATLSWSASDADWLRVFGPGLNGDGEEVTGDSELEVTASAGATFTLRAGNENGTAERTVRIEARSVPAASFLIAGQSNAQGRNLSGSEASSYISADTGVRMLGNDYVWKHAYEPLDDCTGQEDTVSHDPGPIGGSYECSGMGNSGVSLGVSLGNHVSDATGGTVFLIPAAKGGSSLNQWEPRSDRHDRGTLFGSANYRASLAGEERGAPLGYERGGRGYGAVVWYQGESDTNTLSATEAYVDKTDGVLDAFEGELDAPVIVVQLSRREEPDRNRLYQRVREAQRLMASGARTAGGSSSSDAEAGRYLVVTHDLPLVAEGNGDDKHLTADAQVELGRRVALAFREHVLGESVDGSGPRLQGVDVDGSTIWVRTDREITAPTSSGSNAYGGYFSVFDEDGQVPIQAIERDPQDAAAVRITLAEQPVGTPSVAYLPPSGPQSSVATDVVRSAQCNEPMPPGACLPMPAFGLTPEAPLQSLQFRNAPDE